MDTQDFENIAEQIAEALLSSGTSLNDSIATKAKNLDLNPEQIKRLVEFTNRAAFQKYYQNEDKRDDMEFDVADADEILDDVYGKADNSVFKDEDDEATPEENDPFADLQDKQLELKEVLKQPDERKEKEAREKIAAHSYPVEMSDKRKFEIKDLPRLKKIASEIEMNIFSTEQRYWDSLHKLADVFNRYYDPVDYTTFEKVATRLGEDSLPVLTDLRTITKKNLESPLELDTATYYQVKTANEQLAQKLFEESVHYNTKQHENVEAYHYINNKIAGVEKWLKQPA